MAAKPSTPTPASAFRARLDRIGLSQTDLAREMARLGDPRPVMTILRSISNWCRGTTDVPGEMWVILSLLEKWDKKAENNEIFS